MNPAFIHAADQFLAIADSELDEAVRLVKKVLDCGTDTAAASIDLKASTMRWHRTHLEILLTAALLRLARAERTDEKALCTHDL
jgi:hypothetical protein